MSSPLRTAQRPYVAVYMIFCRDNKVPLLLRSNTDWMNDYWCLPSGKVGQRETFASAAVREGIEEAGLRAEMTNAKHAVTMHRYSADGGLYWADIFFEAKKWEGELINGEPESHSDAQWFDLDNLPKNILPHDLAGIEAWRKGLSYVEYGWE